MIKPLHSFILLVLLSLSAWPVAYCRDSVGQTTIAVDEEYEAYKKKGDDFFKAGRYAEARRQYQNCLEVPGFENDAYAKKQIEKCTANLVLRQQADEAWQRSKGQEAIRLYEQLLTSNPDDAITKGQIADYYERSGNQLFNQKRLLEARSHYTEALKYATATKKETLLIQIRTIDGMLRPPKRVGLKVAVGLVAVGAGAYAFLLRNDYITKRTALVQIGQTADPTGSGIIDTDATYAQYENAYKAAEAAQKNNGLYKTCLGVAAVATLAELYLLIHKPKPRTSALQWQPSSQSIGLAVHYSF